MSRPIDTHCHLTSDRFAADRDAVIERLAATLAHAICIGTGLEDAAAAWSLHESHPDLLSVAAGLDPFTSHALGPAYGDEVDRLAAFLTEHRCVALGEIGLDHHYDLGSAAEQIDRFRRQLVLAETLDLPVVIHVREAHEDMIQVLGEHPRLGGVIHSFTAGPAEAEAYLSLGWSLSFNGVLTFKNAPEVREAARLVPADRLLVETDAPYLAPVPRRGKRCEPAWVTHTLACLAAERGESVADCTATTTANARRLFGLPNSG